jgi:hypothetical protein
MRVFAVTEDLNHQVADVQCPACTEPYPEPCPCGGLIHGTPGGETDIDGNPTFVTRCDRCGRTDDQLDEV